MPFCEYDNPAYFRREWWRDGELGGWVTAELIASTMAAGRKVRPFNPGHILGNAIAMTAVQNEPPIDDRSTA